MKEINNSHQTLQKKKSKHKYNSSILSIKRPRFNTIHVVSGALKVIKENIYFDDNLDYTAWLQHSSGVASNLGARQSKIIFMKNNKVKILFFFTFIYNRPKNNDEELFELT